MRVNFGCAVNMDAADAYHVVDCQIESCDRCRDLLDGVRKRITPRTIRNRIVSTSKRKGWFWPENR